MRIMQPTWYGRDSRHIYRESESELTDEVEMAKSTVYSHVSTLVNRRIHDQAGERIPRTSFENLTDETGEVS
jgi:hypothetical protein